MLVLTRRAGQTLRIGDTIELQVVRIEGDRVVLGLVAPREVAIVRGEILAEVADETKAAAGASETVRGLFSRRPG
jgi:carbon storage regulator